MTFALQWGFKSLGFAQVDEISVTAVQSAGDRSV
jgi:hypothetical protein